ncbi:GTPase-associated protein 1-related protein, partial [Streptomyces sp. NPDC004658]|uniref:GTPase-associated protein 1-related protein n=1 Tax=Streptomyces sp. NPDC004658 TaxID=3154672 RepID=UPI0033AEC5A9
AGGVGRLAVTALAVGFALPAAARAAGARWATDHADGLPGPTLTALIGELARETGEVPAGSGRSRGTGDDEPAALAALLARLDGQVPTAVSAPLAARVLTLAVRGRGPVPALGAGSLTPDVRAALARDLAPALRHGIADPAGPAIGRPLALLRLADLLDVDCADLLPEFAGRAARELVDGERTGGGTPLSGDPARDRTPVGGDLAGGGTPARAEPTGGETVGGAEPGDGRPDAALLDAVHAHPALRTALFGALNALAAAHPAAVAGRLAGSGLPVALDPGFPHLRMCVLGDAAGPSGGDRRGRLRAVLHTAGVSPHAEPAVLHTAFRLVWPDGLPTGEEASLLLNELGSDAHRLAGTRDLLVAAALAAPAEDAAVPLLAVDLLRCFTSELAPAHRAPLLLLEFAALLGTDGEGENWVERVRALRDGAVEPVPEQVTRRVYGALARRLLTAPVPESELYALARSGDPALLAAYERAARGATVAERLRTVPSYAAARFCDWTAYQDTDPGWEATRTALLAKVLRPVVRALPAEDQAAVEEALRRTGRGRLDAYRAWNRPGALGRLAGRLTGRGRREDARTTWHGDIQPPAGGGAR